MLILHRRVGETIVLDGITVLAIDRNRVKLGIHAPPLVTIVRGELLKETPGTQEKREKETP